MSQRPGTPTALDIWVSVAGVLTLLEATRRCLGLPMTIMAIVFLVYVFGGPYMPDMIAHKGASLSRAASHMWLTTEGVFGVALGVSTSFVFLYVLFGAMLDQAGAGNYLTRVAFALMGHMRGGPAKASVLSSGLNGLISGSSVANVLTGGNVTIMLMKRVGLLAGEGGRDRGRVVVERPDHAAGDGRRRVPDGRVHQHAVHGDHQARVPAGDPRVPVAVLHRAPRGAEGRHARPAAARRRR